jgi:cysteine-rich repeat protein
MRWIAVVVTLAACTDPEPRCGDGHIDETEGCDDGNGVGGDGCNALCIAEPAITVRWELYPHLGGPALTGACRPDVATIEMVNTLGGTHTVPCDARRSTEIFVPWSEQLLVRLRAADGSIVASSLPDHVFNLEFFAPFYEDAGYLRASYELPEPCTTATPPVELTLTAEDGSVTVGTQRCSAPGHTTNLVTSVPHRAGRYDVQLVTTAGTATATGVRIDGNNAVTDLLLVAR